MGVEFEITNRQLEVPFKIICSIEGKGSKCAKHFAFAFFIIAAIGGIALGACAHVTGETLLIGGGIGTLISGVTYVLRRKKDQKEEKYLEFLCRDQGNLDYYELEDFSEDIVKKMGGVNYRISKIDDKFLITR